jgi:hypothetical protein
MEEVVGSIPTRSTKFLNNLENLTSPALAAFGSKSLNNLPPYHDFAQSSPLMALACKRQLLWPHAMSQKP